MEIQRLRGHGNTSIIDEKEETIGVRGKYGGVNLAMSNALTQSQNRAVLEGLFKKERKRRKKAKEQPPEVP